METKYIKTVIIDNHPLLVNAYRATMRKIESTSKKFNFIVEEIDSYDRTLALIDKKSDRAQNIDLAFLDLHISTSRRRSYLKGEAIGLKIRNLFPESKIIIKADSKDNYQINRMLRIVKPEGFLIMTDVDKEVLRTTIIDVLNDPPFYSKSVLKSFYKSKGHNISLSELDERLLYELSCGIKMKELPEILPLTLAALEKRKQNIKSLFGIEGRDNSMLLKKAREYGFI